MKIICAWCKALIGYKCQFCGGPLSQDPEHQERLVCRSGDTTIHFSTENMKETHTICEACSAAFQQTNTICEACSAAFQQTNTICEGCPAALDEERKRMQERRANPQPDRQTNQRRRRDARKRGYE